MEVKRVKSSYFVVVKYETNAYLMQLIIQTTIDILNQLIGLLFIECHILNMEYNQRHRFCRDLVTHFGAGYGSVPVFKLLFF